jgi:hypothetical protein
MMNSMGMGGKASWGADAFLGAWEAVALTGLESVLESLQAERASANKKGKSKWEIFIC